MTTMSETVQPSSSRTFSHEELRDAAASNKQCYVTRGNKVYEVSEFLAAHPGGEDVILEYAGKDVAEIMADDSVHAHSEAALDILDEHHVGYLLQKNSDAKSQTSDRTGDSTTRQRLSRDEPLYPNTGLSCEEDLTVETDLAEDYKKHRFLDLNRPLLPQMWFGGFSKEFYLDQVHRPRYYKNGASAPLFGNFLEPISKTAWWVIPIVWLPAISYGVSRGMEGMDTKLAGSLYFLLGFGLWSIIEYCMHRFIFHIEYLLPDNRVGLILHFLAHGIHHYLPMDRYRLVMPPALFVVLAYPWYHIARGILWYSWHAAVLAYCGGVFGYVLYDITHYSLHHSNLPSYYRRLKKYHLAHHFTDYNLGFGVTSPFWDKVFGTELILPPIAKTK